MKCPICDVEMRTSDREGVEIDYCPQCRGVWLDRGELEKIMARVEPRPSRERDEHDLDRADDDDHRRKHSTEKHREEERGREGDYRRGGEYKHGGKRREGFLSNLFDMFGD